MNKFFKRNSETCSDTSSIYSNIFKSRKKDSITFLNKLSNDETYFYERRSGILEKKFFNRVIFDYELYIILMLNKIKLDIVPEILDISDISYISDISDINDINDISDIHYTSSGIVYDVNNMISLREVFKRNINFHYLINELLTFLKVIQYSKLLIGNLNIDTIYVKNDENLKFYIIDFSKTNFSDKILDLDFQSLYISLNENNIVSQKNLSYFNQEFSRYTDKRLSKQSFLENIIELYNT